MPDLDQLVKLKDQHAKRTLKGAKALLLRVFPLKNAGISARHGLPYDACVDK
jgi:hypothetical protein